MITPCEQTGDPRTRAWPEPVPEPVPEPGGGAGDSKRSGDFKAPPPPPLDDLDFEPVLIELIEAHPVGGSIPMSRLAVREQFARYGVGDHVGFCERLRKAHAQQRSKWLRNPKMRVREFQYWLTDGDWRLGEIAMVQPAAPKSAEACETCGDSGLVLDQAGFGRYCPSCNRGGGDGGKILFNPGEAPEVAVNLRRWQYWDAEGEVDGLPVIQREARAVAG